MAHRPYNAQSDGPWPEESSRWATAEKVIITADGREHYGYLDGDKEIPSVQKTLSAADTARFAAVAAVKAAEATKQARAATLLAKAKARTLTAAELQEALERALGG